MNKLPSDQFDLLIVGAGFSGLYLLHRLRNAGFSTKVFEAGSAVGGTWHWNCYPGSRPDSDSRIYQYSLEEIWTEWNWTERFPGQKEFASYFEHVATKLHLHRDILFETRLISASFDVAVDRWIVHTANGISASPRFLVLCTGFLSEPLFPQLTGLDSFKGAIHHTARWPRQGVPLKGKRIGVIGTGSTGVQLIQEIAHDASHLTVFQRTPNMALPMIQRRLDPVQQTKIKKQLYPIIFRRRTQTSAGCDVNANFTEIAKTTPEERHLLYEELWERGGLHFWTANYEALFTDEALNSEIYDFWRDKVRERLVDPTMQRMLAPDTPPHPFGVKRPSSEQTYYEVFNLPHVSLVDLQEEPISEVTPGGVKTVNGLHHDLDVLILATGFDSVTGSITSVKIQGSDGEMIGDKWKRGVSSYLGMGCAKFPNMFIVCGPHAPSQLSNGPTCSVRPHSPPSIPSLLRKR